MASVALAIENLSVRYGPVTAVRDISVSVEQGELVALLGTNGAGKTSTLAAIAGLVPRAGGDVRLGDRSIAGLEPEQVVRAGLALSPEGRRVFGRLTVAENLRLGGIPLSGKDELDAAFADVYKLFPKLEQRRNQLSGTLSGGEQQMLAIGRALMARPKVLLLDEPSLGLAPIVVDQIFNLIAELHSSGSTILLVEQNAHRALEVADRACVLVRGSIRLAASAAELRESGQLDDLYLEGDAAI